MRPDGQIFLKKRTRNYWKNWKKKVLTTAVKIAKRTKAILTLFRAGCETETELRQNVCLELIDIVRRWKTKRQDY